MHEVRPCLHRQARTRAGAAESSIVSRSGTGGGQAKPNDESCAVGRAITGRGQAKSAEASRDADVRRAGRAGACAETSTLIECLHRRAHVGCAGGDTTVRRAGL